jgi:bacillolysin
MRKSVIVVAFLLNSIVILAQATFKDSKKVLGQQVKPASISAKITLPDEPIKEGPGKSVFLSGKLSFNATVKSNAKTSAEAAVFEYLQANAKTLNISQAGTEFNIISTDTEANGTNHFRIEQLYKGIPVYGSELIAHGKGAAIELLNGYSYPSPKNLDINPKYTAAKAINFTQTALKGLSFERPLSFAEKSILKYEKPKTTLVVFYPENEPDAAAHLAWQVDIRPNFVERWQFIIDAKSGKVLQKTNRTCTIDGPVSASARDLNNVTRSIKTYQKGSSYILLDATREIYPTGTTVDVENPQGSIWTIDASNTTPEDLKVRQVTSSNNSWSNTTAVSAHYNGGEAYSYFYKTHGRRSLNGKSGSIISIINITEEDTRTGAALQMDNAFWNGEFIGYGNGKDVFRPLAAGLDVAGHEMTHGVIENTANLVYQGQSGALNESMADVFAVLIDRQDGDFVLGEDIMKNGKPFLRSLSDPNKGDQPAHMNERYTGTEDNGGVHINSGIPNKAFYLFVSALSGSEETKKQKAEKIYYRALTKYLTRSSKFTDLRSAIVQSAIDLQAEVGAEAVTAANNAFNAVGIGSTTTTTPPTTKPVEDLPANNGDEFILSYDPCDKAIYLSKEVVKTDADYRVLVPNVFIDHKPSVTDDGSFAYYVALGSLTTPGGTINRVNLSGTPKVEILSQDKVWRNVAISKDGKHLAAVTIETNNADEKYIYVFDLATGKSKNSKLYNPTYSTGLKSAGTPLYADALEWEYNGEFLLYDAFNEIQQTGFSATEAANAIQYWDVGLFKGWDNATNTFGDGSITKVFTNLAKDESIGNPSFAKKSTSVVAFDRLFNNKNSILLVDFESKGADGSYKRSEFANNTIGFPEFSAKDDKLIYNKEINKQAKCTADKTNTAAIGLNADKVSIKGSPADGFIETSLLAVWYTVGKRALPTKANQVINGPVLSDRLEGNSSSIDLNAKTDKGIDVLYSVTTSPSGIARIEAGKLVLTGRPGKVKINGSAEGNTTTNSASFSNEFCVNPAKPTISVTELANAILLQSSADSTNNWYSNGVLFKSNVKGIEITNANSYTLQVTVGGCKSEFSTAYKAGAATPQTIPSTSISAKAQGSTEAIMLPAKTDAGNNITYTVESGPARIVGNTLSLTGAPGRVRVKGFSPAGLKFAEATSTIEFCVNPSKPTITIQETPTEYIFTSSAPSGNNWYRNGTSINEKGTSIKVVSTNSFTVQVDIDGCLSAVSDAKMAPREILLGNEAWIEKGLKLYPIPVADKLNIQLGNNQATNLSIYSNTGKKLQEIALSKKQINTVDISQLAPNTYFVLIDAPGKRFVQKVLKK